MATVAAAATEQSSMNARANGELPAGEAAAGREPEGAHQREASNEPDALPDVAGAVPAPRKRLFESAPAAPLPPSDEPSIPAPQSATAAAEAPAPPSRTGFTSGMAKLGWIRRPIPTELVAGGALHRKPAAAPTNGRSRRRPLRQGTVDDETRDRCVDSQRLRRRATSADTASRPRATNDRAARRLGDQAHRWRNSSTTLR